MTVANINKIIIFNDITTTNFNQDPDNSYGYVDLTEEQLKVEKYKLQPEGVKAVIDALKNCSSINNNNYFKATQFMKKYNLTLDDCLFIIHNLKVSDYYANTRSFNSEYGRNNLIIFEPDSIILEDGRELKNIVLYIKIDLDETTNEAVALVSIHDGAQNNLPYINGDFEGIVEDYYLYENYDDTIYDFLVELLEDN